jgi:hypothetical protein
LHFLVVFKSPVLRSQEEHTWRAQPSVLLQQQLFHSQGLMRMLSLLLILPQELTILLSQLLVELKYRCFLSKAMQPSSSQLSILLQKLLFISRYLQMH